eukprot:TRINITY_DN5197_c0_g1_i1.p1 TRINITY_DN5197_c0_g1~~TRINITY_DN5197_c0_g1_i1.p1  ORF type:complete len:399 (+),score=90.78 TRINITY_DN5197_c0_g1_i1:30-1199(+)
MATRTRTRSATAVNARGKHRGSSHLDGSERLPKKRRTATRKNQTSVAAAGGGGARRGGGGGGGRGVRGGDDGSTSHLVVVHDDPMIIDVDDREPSTTPLSLSLSTSSGTVPPPSSALSDEGVRYDHEYDLDVHQTHLENEIRYFTPLPFLDVGAQQVNSKMRAILIEWLIEVAEEYSLTSLTLFLSVKYVDRFLCEAEVSRSTLQLLGVTSMLIASKYEEVLAPIVDDFVYITDGTYSREEILHTEQIVLRVLGFRLSLTTTQNFLDRFLLFMGVQNDARVAHHAHYLAELSLPLYSLTNCFPSHTAAACVVLSLHTFQKPYYTPAFKSFVKFTPADLLPPIREIYDAYVAVSMVDESQGSVHPAREKYKAAKYLTVSDIAPPTNLPFS